MVNVVIGIIEQNDKILLIQRERGDFVNLWGLPGGKVEECEHLDEAVIREMKEEISVEMEFKSVLGFSTEIMHDKNSTSLIYVCHLSIKENEVIDNPEFKYKWFSKQEIIDAEDIIGSDKVFIEEFYINKSSNYLKMDCYRDVQGNYYWK